MGVFGSIPGRVLTVGLRHLCPRLIRLYRYVLSACVKCRCGEKTGVCREQVSYGALRVGAGGLPGLRYCAGSGRIARAYGQG